MTAPRVSSLEPALAARLRGVNVWIEAVAPHLVLDSSYAERKNFEGARYVMSPPLRDKRHQDTLWAGLKSRTISTVGTDHAPFTLQQKDMGRDAFPKIPNGIPALQDRVDLLHTLGVAKGKLSVNDFVDVAQSLIEAKYTSRGRIAIMGGSAGGSLVGAVVNEAPELWGAAVAASRPSSTCAATQTACRLPSSSRPARRMRPAPSRPRPRAWPSAPAACSATWATMLTGSDRNRCCAAFSR